MLEIGSDVCENFSCKYCANNPSINVMWKKYVSHERETVFIDTFNYNMWLRVKTVFVIVQELFTPFIEKNEKKLSKKHEWKLELMTANKNTFLYKLLLLLIYNTSSSVIVVKMSKSQNNFRLIILKVKTSKCDKYRNKFSHKSLREKC